MNRQIFTYAPIISLVSNSRNSRAPINFNDSISKGRNKITCNNNRASCGKEMTRSQGPDSYATVMRIHVWIGELKLRIKLAIQTISWMRVDSRSMREKCKWCDFVGRPKESSSQLGEIHVETWEDFEYSCLTRDLILWISARKCRVSRKIYERDTRQLCWCIISIWYSSVSI